MLLFKILGFLATILATYSFGYLKSHQLHLRSKKLHSIKKGLISLKEQIRVGYGEIKNLLSSSFSEFPLDTAHLEKEDITLLNEFFKDIGMGDTVSECEKCELYINLLNLKIEEADQNHKELSKLYRSIGLLSGVFICIILL